MRLAIIFAGFFAGVVMGRAHEAKVVNIAGAGAIVITPRGGAAAMAKVGSTVPEGAQLATEGDVFAYVEVFPGGVVTIRPGSLVVFEKLSLTTEAGAIVSQDAVVEVKKGWIVAQLDPAKKRINHFGVRTPQGLATANGTVYTISVEGATYSIFTGSGSVTITPANGGPAVTLGAGLVAISTFRGGAATPASAISGDPALAAIVNQAAVFAAATLATVAANPQRFGAADAATAGTELAETIATIVRAVPQAVAAATSAAAVAAPSQAAAIVTAAISAQAGTAENQAELIQKVTSAVAQGATSADPTKAAAVAQQVSQAAVAAALGADVTNSSFAAAVKSAAQGAAEGAARAAPSAIYDVAKGAAKGAAQGAVQQMAAIATKKALDGGQTSAEATKAGQSAALLAADVAATNSSNGAGQGAKSVDVSFRPGIDVIQGASAGVTAGVRSTGAVLSTGVLAQIADAANRGVTQSTGDGTSTTVATVLVPAPVTTTNLSPLFPVTTPVTPIDPAINVSRSGP